MRRLHIATGERTPRTLTSPVNAFEVSAHTLSCTGFCVVEAESILFTVWQMHRTTQMNADNRFFVLPHGPTATTVEQIHKH